jgi:hypothetical protein
MEPLGAPVIVKKLTNFKNPLGKITKHVVRCRSVLGKREAEG